MRLTPLWMLLVVLSLAGCAAQSTAPAAQHVPRPHTCNWYKPRPAGEGVTRLSFRIEVSGRLRDIAVARSSGSDEIDKASMGCASHWHYFPATMDAKPVETSWGAQIDWRRDGVAVTELSPAQ
jgi:TonB family protein